MIEKNTKTSRIFGIGKVTSPVTRGKEGMEEGGE